MFASRARGNKYRVGCSIGPQQKGEHNQPSRKPKNNTVNASKRVGAQEGYFKNRLRHSYIIPWRHSKNEECVAPGNQRVGRTAVPCRAVSRRSDRSKFYTCTQRSARRLVAINAPGGVVKDAEKDYLVIWELNDWRYWRRGRWKNGAVKSEAATMNTNLKGY